MCWSGGGDRIWGRIGAQPAAWSVSQADIVYYLPTTEHSRKGFIIVGGDALDTQYLLHARHRILAQLLPSLQDFQDYSNKPWKVTTTFNDSGSCFA